MAKATNGRFAKVIFFIADLQPTDAEMAAAGEIGPGVVFRNAMYVPENPSPGSIEVCDFVAGDNIPKPYADRFPKWNGSDEADASQEPARLFDHDKAGNEGPQVTITKPGVVPTSETGSPVDPNSNLSLDPTTGEPLQRAKTASDEGQPDVIDPTTGQPFVVGNNAPPPSTDLPLTGRADTVAHAHNSPARADANAEAASLASGATAGAAAAPTTPATPTQTPASPAKPDTAPKPAAAPKATPAKAAATAPKPTGWKPNT